MSRNNAKIKSEAPILTSPEGVKIQITAGRKLQVIRSYAEDPEITDAQFRALVCLVDRLNEGRSGDERRWGSAYPNYETLAKDIAKDARAAKRIIKELKTGQREIRSKSGERKLVPCKAVLNVKSTKKGKSDEVNEYRLKKWGAFAVTSGEDVFTASPQSEEGEATGQEGCGDPSGGGRSPLDERPVTAPNSSHGPRSETHPKDPPQSAPTSGERGPDVGSDEWIEITLTEDRRSRETQEDKVVQDNQKDDGRLEQYQKAAEKIWLMFHKAPVEQHDGFIELFVELAQAGEIKNSEEVRYGLMCHLRDTEPKWQKYPVNFLKKRVWKTYRATASGAGETQKRMAI
ncbi:hypothetical protein ABIF96_003089 [Bradyrhizobium ottawaense]|uniref:hypothetical protein n=1 Tax=Bradyrhizobium ottawaense TaxID=931866 RepID=UPI0038339F52